MPMIADYQKAHRVMLGKIEPLGVSAKLGDIATDDGKVRSALQKMDRADGGPADKMGATCELFEATLNKWLLAFEAQVRKEAQKAKLKQPLSAFQMAIFQMVEGFKSRMAERAEASERGASAAGDAAARANAKKLAAAIKHFNDQRDRHLEVSNRVMVSARRALKMAVGWRKEGAGILKAAEAAAAQGDGTQANALARRLGELAAEVDGKADEAAALHDRHLREDFQKDRNMRFGTLQRKFDLPDEAEAPFLANQKAGARIFTQATENGKQALAMIAQMRTLEQELLRMMATAEAAARGGEDFERHVITDLTASTGAGSGARLRQAIADYNGLIDRLDSTNGRTERALARAEGSGATEAEVEGARARLDPLNDAMARTDRSWSALETQFKSVERGVPKPFKANTTVKSALRQILNDMVLARREHGERRKVSEKLWRGSGRSSP